MKKRWRRKDEAQSLETKNQYMNRGLKRRPAHVISKIGVIINRGDQSNTKIWEEESILPNDEKRVEVLPTRLSPAAFRAT